MVICRPKCAPVGSPAQPSTQPPPPTMMLGPGASTAVVVLPGTGACDLPPNMKYAPTANTTTAAAVAIFAFAELRNDVPDACPEPKVGTSKLAGAGSEDSAAFFAVSGLLRSSGAAASCARF